MKKIMSLITVFSLLTIFIFAGNSYAESLDAINLDVNKTIVRPGEDVTVTVDFGESLGAYTVDVSYDDAIFEYVSLVGGAANDTGDKVIITFYDSTGGNEPRSNMSVTFKAKDDITTSNPTEFTVTAEGLANPDASVTFDDITTPIVKNVTVEPEYVDYSLKLEATGNIIKEEENVMTLSYSSSMGRYYEHARLIADATTPDGATVKLLGTDEAQLEHDIIQSGWGDAQGFEIGGKDVSQVLNVRGVFSEVGDYSITLKLIDRDNSDSVIAENSFSFTAVEAGSVVTPEITTPGSDASVSEEKEVAVEKVPSNLPKTGYNIYIPVVLVLVGLVSFYVVYNKRK